jgi:hypothetical protein
MGYEGVAGVEDYFALAGGAVGGGGVEARATVKAGPPFGFAQGRLFGDDNKKDNCNCKDKGKNK